MEKTPIPPRSARCHERDTAWCRGGSGEGTRRAGHSGKEGFLEDGVPPWTTLDIWRTWSQFPELPFSNYVTALPVGACVPGGTGAGARGSRCASHTPSGLHNSSDTEIAVVLHWKKESQAVYLFVAYHRLSAGHPGITPETCWCPHPALRSERCNTHPHIRRPWRQHHPPQLHSILGAAEAP